MKKNNNINIKYFATAFILLLGVVMMIAPGSKPENSSDSVYEKEAVLETKISSMISKIYSVDNVSVILTYDTTGEKIYQPGETDKILINKDDSYLKSEKLPYVRGALIAVEHIDTDTAQKIKNAISVLLGISTEKVTVIYN